MISLLWVAGGSCVEHMREGWWLVIAAHSYHMSGSHAIGSQCTELDDGVGEALEGVLSGIDAMQIDSVCLLSSCVLRRGLTTKCLKGPSSAIVVVRDDAWIPS